MNIERKLERVIGAVERSLDVAQHRIKPVHVARLGSCAAAGTLDDRMRVTGLNDGAKRAQSVAVYLSVGVQMLQRPVRQRLQREARYGRHYRLPRMSLIGELHGHHERDLVLRPAPGFAAVTLAAKVRIVEGHDTVEPASRLTFDHALHDLVLDAPCRAVAHAQMPHQLQRGHVGLALRQQIQRQEPARQRQLGAGKQRVGDQAGLMPAGRALPQTLAMTIGATTVAPMLAARADKPFGPTRSAQRAGARRFGAVLIKESGQRQAGLKLDTIHSHERDLCDGGCSVTQARRIDCDGGLTSALIRKGFVFSFFTSVGLAFTVKFLDKFL